MAIYHFNVSVPSTVKQGQICRIEIPTVAVVPSSSILRLMLTPSNASIYPEVKNTRIELKSGVGGFSITNSQYILFTFSELGNYTLFIEYTDGADTWRSSSVITCASWASNMDEPVSNISKQATEISRLRTTIKRNGNNNIF